MLGRWKNNGPRPPWDPLDLIAILVVMCKLFAFYMLFVVGLNLLAMGILEVLRRHHIGL